MQAATLGEIVDSVRNSPAFIAHLQKKGRVLLEHVCEGAQSFAAACVIRHHASRSSWVVCPDVRRQEEIIWIREQGFTLVISLIPEIKF